MFLSGTMKTKINWLVLELSLSSLCLFGGRACTIPSFSKHALERPSSPSGISNERCYVAGILSLSKKRVGGRENDREQQQLRTESNSGETAQG